MDPISALNIAAAVVQFIDFTGKLIKDYGEIRHTGQPLTYEAFEQTTNDLLKLGSTLKDRTKTLHIGKGGLKDHEEVRDCTTVHVRIL
jgi:hypothetical protein